MIYIIYAFLPGIRVRLIRQQLPFHDGALDIQFELLRSEYSELYGQFMSLAEIRLYNVCEHLFYKYT